MRFFALATIVIAVVFQLPSVVGAADVLDVGRFTLGVLTGFAVDKVGHQLTAWSTGDTLHWSGPGGDGLAQWRCGRGCNARTIAFGGWAAQAASSEVLLAVAPKDSPYFDGWLVGNIAKPVIFTIGNEVSRNGWGDLRNFSRDQARIVGGVFISHAILTGYRLFVNDSLPRFPFFFKSDGKDLVVGLEFKFAELKFK